MNVVIYDTEHFETTHTLIRIFDTPENQLSLFVDPLVSEALRHLVRGNTSIDWNIVPKHSKRNVYQLYRYCRKHHTDLLLLNTVSAHHLLFSVLCSLLTKTRVLITVHDAHGLFRPGKKGGWRAMARYAGKKWLAGSVDGFAVLLSTTRDFLVKHYGIRKPIYIFPGAAFEKPAAVQGESPLLKIVIPGSVDFRRRDYGQLLSLLPLLHASRPVCFVLLGAAKDDKAQALIREANARCPENVSITAYDDFVSQEEYDTQLSGCAIVFAPLVSSFPGESDLPELYGLTKSSGSFFDAIRFGKVLLVPASISVPAEMEPLCFRYASVEELAAWILAFEGDRQQAIQDKARKQAESWSVAAIRKELPWF